MNSSKAVAPRWCCHNHPQSSLALMSQAHYCVAFGVKDELSVHGDFGFKRFTAAPPRFPQGD